LRILCPTKHRNWYLFLKDIEHRLNDTYHRTTGFPPATLFLRVKFTISGAKIPLIDSEYAEILKRTQEETKLQLERRKRVNQGSLLTELTEGSRVYVRNFKQSDAEAGQTKKMFKKFIGPCTVLEKRGLNSYLIERPDGVRDTYHIFHIHY